MRLLLALVALSVTAFADSAPTAPCGAPCKDAERYLRGKDWNYRKSAAIYREQCKADYSGPPDACRLYALAGYETRGTKLKEDVVLAILDGACKRGDVPACGWKLAVADRDKPAEERAKLAAYAFLEAPCRTGDGAACGPLFLAMGRVVRKQCPAAWWKLADDACKANLVDGCIFVEKMFSAEHSCDRKAAPLQREHSLDRLEKLCVAGQPDACIEVRHNDDELWRKRCKAGEQFACDSLR